MAQLGSSMNDFCEACAFGVRSSFRCSGIFVAMASSGQSSPSISLLRLTVCFAPWYRNKLRLRSLICGAQKFPRTFLVTHATHIAGRFLSELAVRCDVDYATSRFFWYPTSFVGSMKLSLKKDGQFFRTYKCI
nr:hypothetical protein Iba_chr09cCG4000 [Ipomoea batatas]